MAPTESTILTNFLLRPAQLPSITTLAQFTSFFPSAQQSSPEIKRLYRSLQSQRATLTDAITNNIAVEEKRGKILQRAVVYSRRRDEAGNGAAYDGGEEDEEGLIEKAIFGETGRFATRKPHTLRTVMPELAQAEVDLEAEIAELEEEADRLLADINGVVDGLSDLRYGKFADAGIATDVLEGLKSVKAVCEGK